MRHLFKVSVAAMLVTIAGVWGEARANQLDAFNTAEMQGTLTQVGNSLSLNLTMTDWALSGSNAYVSAMFYTGAGNPSGFAGPWDDSHLFLYNASSNGGWAPAVNDSTGAVWGQGSGSTHPWSNQGALPTGVSFSVDQVGNDHVWDISVSLDALGISSGDSFSYFVQSRYDNQPGLTTHQSHGSEGFNPLYFSENFQSVGGDGLDPTVIPVPPAAGLILLGMAGLGIRRKFKK